jgi:hypothetical protein
MPCKTRHAIKAFKLVEKPQPRENPRKMARERIQVFRRPRISARRAIMMQKER